MSNANKLEKNFTTGSIPKQLLEFSVPFMISNAAQVLYSIVDMLIVGKYVGSDGLAAVSGSSMIVNLCTMLCVSFATGAQIYISQFMGAGRRDRLNSTVGTVFSSLTILGTVIGIMLFVLRYKIATLMQTPAQAYDMTVIYLGICGGGMLFTSGYNMVSAVLRGKGDSHHPFVFIMIASAVNVVLDFLFTGLMGFGVAGAAWATIIGQAVSFIFSIVYLYIHREEFGFDFKAGSFVIEMTALSQLVKLGIPLAIQYSVVSISMLFVNRLVNATGVTSAAAFGVGLKIDDVINKVTLGIMTAVSIMVGQNITAGKTGRAKQAVYWGWIYSGIFYAVFILIFRTYNREMFSFFTDDADVIALAPVFFAALVWQFPALAVMRGSNGFIHGIGNTRLSMLCGIFDGLILRITFSYLLGNVMGMGLFGYFLGYGIAAYGSAVPGTIYFFSGIWKDRAKKLQEQISAE